jgi:sugar lactone lactonase YvrE
MKPLIATVFVLLVTLSLAATAHSGVVNLTCTASQKKIFVYHTNGIYTPNDDARLNLGLLEKALVQSLATAPPDPGIPLDKVCFQFRLTYNPTSGFVNDLFQVAGQLYQLAPTEFWIAEGRLSLGVDLLDLVTLGDLHGFINYVEDLAAKKMATPDTDPLTIQAHADTYRQAIFGSCGSVLLVPHSQGNLYAHLAYNELIQPNPPPVGTIAYVGVAETDVSTPLAYPLGSYVTSDTDEVIKLLRALVPSVLPFNTDWSAASSRQTITNSGGHAFAGYLAFDNSATLLMTDLLLAVNSLSRQGCGLQFSQSTYAGSAPSIVHITITRTTGGSATDESVAVSTSDGTAHAGVDYVPLSQLQVAFQPGDVSKTVDITLLNNSSSLDGITVNLTLSQSGDGTTLGTAVLNITKPNTGTGSGSGGTSGFIFTFAGTGVSGTGGDGGPAISAQLECTYGLAVNTGGDVYILDICGSSPRVRKVDAQTGIITTVAGGGSGGLGGGVGDGGPATSAYLLSPLAIALDTAGNLYIAGGNHVRKVDAQTGIITTVAGGGLGADGGLAINATLDRPAGVAIDISGNLYIAESFGDRVRKVDAHTGVITTVAGTGNGRAFFGDGGPATSAELLSPEGLSVDAIGNLYILDTDNIRVRKVDGRTGIITTVAGNGSFLFSGDNGPAISAGLSTPRGIALDASGNLYIADSGGSSKRVRKVDAQTGIITTVAGGGPSSNFGDGRLATSAWLGSPYAVAVDTRGNLYIADYPISRVWRVEP